MNQFKKSSLRWTMIGLGTAVVLGGICLTNLKISAVDNPTPSQNSSSSINHVNEDSAAQETLRTYFEGWNEKNVQKINSVDLGLKMECADDLSHYDSVTLHQIKKRNVNFNHFKKQYPKSWLGLEPYDIRYFQVNYTVKLNENAVSAIEEGNYNEKWYVIKKDKDSPWKVCTTICDFNV